MFHIVQKWLWNYKIINSDIIKVSNDEDLIFVPLMFEYLILAVMYIITQASHHHDNISKNTSIIYLVDIQISNI